MLIKSLICILIFSIPTEVFSASISWITGSYNYLWPVSCLLLTILPFKNSIFKEEFNKKWCFLLIFTAILGANMEQVLLIMFVFAFITNIYIAVRDKKIRIDLVIFNIFIAINTAVLFLAPGNYERSKLSELLRKWRINIFVILVSILIFWSSFVLYLEYILNKG